MMNLTGKISEANFDDYWFKVDLAFVDEQAIKDLEAELKEGGFKTIVLKPSKHKDLINYQMQKKWFACLSEILKHDHVPRTQENIDALSYVMKREYLPIKTITIGGKLIDIVASMSYLASSEDGVGIDDWVEAIQKMQDDYKSLGYEFKQG